MSYPNKGKACFCTGECHQKDTQTKVQPKILYRPDKITFAGGIYVDEPINYPKGLGGFYVWQKLRNNSSRRECEFLAYDPSDDGFCYIRYGLYNAQRVEVKELEVI